MKVKELDNRDHNTTWVWTGENNFVEVNPVELFQNMVENCYNDDMAFLVSVLVQFMEQDMEYHMDNELDIRDTKHNYIKSFAYYLKKMSDHLDNLEDEED